MSAARAADARHASAVVKSLVGILGTPRLIKRPSTLAKREPDKEYQNIDVVGEDLCDDVIKYLSPTLQKHKGCTLIDINPGPCVFSSKLNDFLKPERHILLEPEEKYFEPFIKPLLESNSTYHCTPFKLWGFPGLRKYQDAVQKDAAVSGLLAESSDGKSYHGNFDPSILVIGNMARQIGKARSGAMRNRTMSTTDHFNNVLHDITIATLAQQNFSRNGQVRMLLWMSEAVKPQLQHLLAHQRVGVGTKADLAFNITEVAGIRSRQEIVDSRPYGFNWASRKRDPLLDKMNVEAVAERMRESGMVVPEGRRRQILEPAILENSQETPFVSPLKPTMKSLSQLREGIASLAARVGDLPLIRHKQQFTKQMESDAAKQTLQFPQVPAAVKAFDKALIAQKTSSFVVDLIFRLINLEANFKELEEKKQIPDAATLEELRGALLRLDEQLTEFRLSRGARFNKLALDIVDDHIASISSPPLCNWDNRRYEPLQASASDYWPECGVALFDCVPTGINLAVPDLADSLEGASFCNDLVNTLFTSRDTALPKILDKVGVNASQDLIPMVPAITDARKGGRLNPSRMKVRMLTSEMIEGLVKAFFEWPFRPPRWQLALAGGSNEGGGEEETSTDSTEVQSEASDK